MAICECDPDIAQACTPPAPKKCGVVTAPATAGDTRACAGAARGYAREPESDAESGYAV